MYKRLINRKSTLVFIDQPLAVGYSMTKSGANVSDSGEAAENMINFFFNFYTAYP
jgi:carboxypeptidase C (cathepsin A)